MASSEGQPIIRYEGRARAIDSQDVGPQHKHLVGQCENSRFKDIDKL